MTVRTCNNCDIDKCRGAMNSVVGCKNHRDIIFKVLMRMLISKVTIGKDAENTAVTAPMFQGY